MRAGSSARRRGILEVGMRLALAQINTVVGDLDGNRDRILRRLDEAKAAGADIVLFLALAGAELIANISASPFHVGRDREREEMLVTRARDNSVFLAFCNAVGGQDELIFDGHSLVLDDEGTVLARAPGFEECLLLVDLDPTEVVARRLRDVRRRALARERGGIPHVAVIHVGAPHPSTNVRHVEPGIAEPLDDLEQMRQALELGLRDYVEKNGFSEVVV